MATQKALLKGEQKKTGAKTKMNSEVIDLFRNSKKKWYHDCHEITLALSVYQFSLKNQKLDVLSND